MSKRPRYRGYIGSRAYNGYNIPHRVQNLVIRDLCERQGYEYLLSVTEYSLLGSYIMLEEALRELPEIDGIILYSIFMLPQDKLKRARIFDRIFDHGAKLHGALENLTVDDKTSFQEVEDLINLNRIISIPAELHSTIKNSISGESF